VVLEAIKSIKYDNVLDGTGIGMGPKPLEVKQK
jgi:hypothetical protein